VHLEHPQHVDVGPIQVEVSSHRRNRDDLELRRVQRERQRQPIVLRRHREVGVDDHAMRRRTDRAGLPEHEGDADERASDGHGRRVYQRC